MSNYDNIPISDETKKGMTLTIDDQAFIKRVLDRQDEAIERYISETYDTHAGLICQSLAEVIQAHNDKIFGLLEEQNKSIAQIRDDIENIKESIGHLTLDIKDIRLEIKSLKVETKSISLDVENLTKRIAEHDWRIQRVEKHLEL